MITTLTAPLRDLLRTAKSVDATNTVWRLHSRATVFTLAFFTILLSARSYFGEPIDCIASVASDYRKSMNNFCWVLGTFISRDPAFTFASWDVIEIGMQMGNIPEAERLYQKYYQWVPFVLAIQAFLFSFPKHLWRFYEGERLQTLCKDLTSILPPAEWTPQRKADTLYFFLRESHGKMRRYALMFVFCEALNLAVVVLNIGLVNFIFGDFWNSYQPAMQALFAMDMNAWTRYNSLVFPKLAKCDFHFIGPSGSKQNMDALCLLPQNILNEKIFAFLWVWFIALGVASGAQVLYRVVQMCSQGVRFQLLYKAVAPTSYHRLKRVSREATFGHWFMLYQMARNVNRVVMKDLIRELSKLGSDGQNLSRQNLEELQKQQLQQLSLTRINDHGDDDDDDDEQGVDPEDDEVTV
uniref:Innexin n=1 Tax=Culex tarsalis TaxID=7177 RepID=A0A1Q3EVQ8_CULTA